MLTSHESGIAVAASAGFQLDQRPPRDAPDPLQRGTPVMPATSRSAAVSVLRKLSDAQKAQLVERVLDHYTRGIELKQIAPGLGVHEKTLYRLILKTDAAGWYVAQRVRLDLELDDSLSSGDALKTDSQRNSWDHRDARLQRNKRKFEERQ
jgi:hypothetical protein